MSDSDLQTSTDQPVPDDVIAPGMLPPLRYRDLPEPVPLRKMFGPGIILAGLSLGSGEFILWPYITYKTQFIFFWACLLGVATQYFLNMEITRWTLATGESAITGFCRLSKKWAWVFLAANILPWMIPAWAKGAAEILSWLLWPPTLAAQATEAGTVGFDMPGEGYVTPLAIGGMVLCGLILTAGPVIYNTVERIQMVLVGSIIILVLVLGAIIIRADAVTAQLTSTLTLGYPEFFPRAVPDSFTQQLTPILLLGALAFAGAGGTLNLGQSNYIKDKGYGMGRHIGRITSPITGQEEPISEVGYHFPHTQTNLARWQTWWRRASLEHFFSFFLTCVVCLVLLTLLSYSLFYDADGVLKPGAEKYGQKMHFVLGEAVEIERTLGSGVRLLFLVMGIAILLTTEFGVLDGASRISTDIVKVNWLQDNTWWTESRLYYAFLWGTILFGSGVLLLESFEFDVNAFVLFKLTAAMNGGVMFVYALTLLFLNGGKLPQPLKPGPLRIAILYWAVAFFGFFAVWASWTVVGG